MGLGPFDLAGPEFLKLYAVLFGLALVAGLAIPRWLRAEGRALAVTDEDELAFLAGNRPRLAETVAARLLAAGALMVEGRNRLRVRAHEQGKSPAERAVLALSSPIRWQAVEHALASTAERIEAGLVRDGLMIAKSESMQLRLWQTLPYFLLFGFGAVKWMVGSGRDKPVEILSAFLAITFFFALVRFGTVDRRTRGGMAALASAREKSERLRRAPAEGETGMAVALFGTTVLAGSWLSDFHSLRSSAGSNSTSSDSSSSCSSDGGGGGCGGCGGD